MTTSSKALDLHARAALRQLRGVRGVVQTLVGCSGADAGPQRDIRPFLLFQPVAQLCSSGCLTGSWGWGEAGFEELPSLFKAKKEFPSSNK